MIYVNNLSFSHGVKSIFDGVTFSISDNQKVGLVGANGTGKTTLLKILTGRETPNQGKIEISGTMAFVPQEVKLDPDLENSPSIRDYLDPQHLQPDFKLGQMLAGLELEYLKLEAKPQNLSGGQKTKLALIRALILEPDILLLDEPTNFVDVKGREWVMNFLSTYPKTLILISHDLELLDKYIDKVLFVRPQTHKIEEYSGNYSKFLKLKEEKEALLIRQVKNQQQRINQLEESVKKLKQFNTFGRAGVILQRRVERLKESLPELPEEIKKIKINFPDPPWVGELPIRVSSISKSYGENQVLENINLAVRRGERIALVGPNGAGKSTLLKIMMGLINPDSGEVIYDQKTDIGYYSQEFEILDQEKTLVEVIMDQLKISDYKTIPILSNFLFKGNMIYQKISSLSGGEKTRLSILLIMLQAHNLLILDEPTTYLDPLSQRIILEALKQYKGTIIIVSHTEDFLKELEPTRGILLPENLVDIWSEKFLNKVEEI